MAIDVKVDVERDFSVDCSAEEVFDLLSDVPRSVGHFPKVDTLTDMGDNTFQWEMEKVGVDKYSIQTVYACKYESDRKAGRIWWTPKKGVGNSVFEGSWTISQAGSGAHIHFQTGGTLTVPLPRLAKMIVAPMAKREFEGMVDTYIKNLKKTFNS